MKPKKPTLSEWDEMQDELAKIFAQQSATHWCLEEEGLSGAKRRELESEIVRLNLKEDALRKRIAAASRSLQIELKNRKDY